MKKKRKPFKAVEFQRKVRRQLDRKYAGMSLLEREKAIQKELEKDPWWQALREKSAGARLKHAA